MKLRPPSLGRMVYLGWHLPRGFVRRCAKEGPINLWLTTRGRRQMEQAARALQPITRTTATPTYGVHFLTGKKFWYQTLYCAYSLLKKADEAIRVHIVDDGSLQQENIDLLQRILPFVDIERAPEVGRRLDRELPSERFPALRARRLVYPHLRKLTDVHAGQKSWRLVLDSDMLFHHRPTDVLQWLGQPDRPLYMLDVENAYGYSPTLMRDLAQHDIPERVNVGVCGLQSETIDWDQLEHWCKTLLEREGSHYLQEQALTAMLVAGQECKVLPASDYIVRPTRAETQTPTSALHHYVAESKAWYFRDAWRRIAKES
jgi:hypothetical protein